MPVREIKPVDGEAFDEGDLFRYELRPTDANGAFATLTALELKVYSSSPEVTKSLLDFTLDTSNPSDKFYYYDHVLAPNTNLFVATSTGGVVAVHQSFVNAEPKRTSL